MDEDFEYFLEKMGPVMNKRHVPPSSIARFRGKLPDQLLAYWEEHGWCGYAEGLFWTVDPQEYEPVLEAWIGETPLMERDAYHVIARSAFGELYFWGEQTGNTLTLFAPGSYCFPTEPAFQEHELEFGMRVFFGMRKRKDNDFAEMFSPALKKLGQLKHDEMYGFVPALALGGPSELPHLQKVKAVEHLVLLAQLAPLEVMRSPTLTDF
ncbi:GAD-like domain-containing protein [Pseudoduganella sp. R-34]|uniref:GAD-like domain-containing protein n=1 Tax=unclassified Pseudoduganella TaxID=2637179 RepID=UPI003CF6DD9C